MTSDFIYGCTRLQARLARLIQEREWRRFGSIQDPQRLIDAMLQSPAADWVRGLDGDSDPAHVENLLRLRFGEHIDLIQTWIPDRWHDSLQWVRLLPWLNLLPAIVDTRDMGHYLSFRATPLETVASLSTGARLHGLSQSDFKPLVPTLLNHGDLYAAWLDAWQYRWPRRADQAYLHTRHLTMRFLAAYRDLVQQQSDPLTVAAPLLRQLHQNTNTIIAVFAYLGIQLLQLVYLRRLLLDRLLFARAA